MIQRLGFAIAIAAVILAASAGLRWAEHAALLSPETGRRVMQVLIGLALAAYANLMPKQLAAAPRSPKAEARSQSALRVGGWSLTLAGLAYAALWAFTPLAFADVASMVVVIAGTAVTLGYAVWAYASCRPARDAAAGR
jgi:hypothetical protein